MDDRRGSGRSSGLVARTSHCKRQCWYLKIAGYGNRLNQKSVKIIKKHHMHSIPYRWRRWPRCRFHSRPLKSCAWCYRLLTCLLRTKISWRNRLPLWTYRRNPTVNDKRLDNSPKTHEISKEIRFVEMFNRQLLLEKKSIDYNVISSKLAS